MSEQKIPYKIYISEDEIPKQCYNVRADMRSEEHTSELQSR